MVIIARIVDTYNSNNLLLKKSVMNTYLSYMLWLLEVRLFVLISYQTVGSRMIKVHDRFVEMLNEKNITE